MLKGKKIWSIFLNRYVVCLTLFGVWMVFFDENNLSRQIKSRAELNKLRNEKQYYDNKIKDYNYQLESLEKNPQFVEKFARETYYMSKENEDVFIAVPDTVKN